MKYIMGKLDMLIINVKAFNKDSKQGRLDFVYGVMRISGPPCAIPPITDEPPSVIAPSSS